MVELEIDGQKVQVPEGAMVMDAATQLGIYVPHFCYHHKLTIAANCRMCLVDVEKAPKPLPACATPAAQGMVVRTHSERALQAQKGVMEFLLINHPLDCPICDQGGECQLQDLAVGYGGSVSRYTEEKRVIFHKDAGPLIAMEEMSRCIQCTRCVRFGQEIAGIMELGMANRGEHSEIMTFVGSTVDSELSGNMIDICPVGALTSKPFRYSARTWELSRRASISPHDSVGANLIVQVKGDRVMRVVPQENEAVNECWISDRDRFAYEGLNSEERLTAPQIRENGQWKSVDWQTALEFTVQGLRRAMGQEGGAALAALAVPTSTVEELYLLKKLLTELGSNSLDTRLRQSDFSGDANAAAIPWLGMPIAEMGQLQAALFIGSTLRKEQPLLSARVRQAAKAGAKISTLHAANDDWLMPLHARIAAAPSLWVAELAGVARAVAQVKGIEAPASLQTVSTPSAQAQAIAASLLGGEHKAVFLGDSAVQHPQAATLRALAQWIAREVGGICGDLTEAGNTVGAALLGVSPLAPGRDVAKIIAQPPRAMMLFGVEPEEDSADPVALHKALEQAEFIVSFSPFVDAAEGYAHVMLPIAPFTETAGSLVNAEGRLQSFNPVVQPLGETRPGWKVLRVLGNLFELQGFDYQSAAEVRTEAFAGLGGVDQGGADQIAARLAQSTPLDLPSELPASVAPAIERFAPVPIYSSDTIVRRAPSLQRTRDARNARMVGVSTALWEQLGLQNGDSVRVKVDTVDAQSVVLPARCDDALAPTVVSIAAAWAEAAPLGSLGAMSGAVQVERVGAVAAVPAAAVPTAPASPERV
ncbi:MAG: NADH-quinone oxidoreductase subunit NuoG [Thiomonas sp.]|uniref:NADH-quinone oxidoreductase subunit NuoG n=1 Tax=Thiomonas TaxID=32012 RepID=UPI00257EB23E|nr:MULTISPECIES: NADH-quinone oxidoreductase subunit NuoG [Thiomonas]HML81023.1 NADH-quinone oxidoreductase subunit NuoG [Thiomonas arsenitoxydans]